MPPPRSRSNPPRGGGGGGGRGATTTTVPPPPPPTAAATGGTGSGGRATRRSSWTASSATTAVVPAAAAVATTRRTRAASSAGLGEDDHHDNNNPPPSLPGRKKARRDNKRETAPPPEKVEEDTTPPPDKSPELGRLLDALRGGEDLPTLYAALKLARERLDKSGGGGADAGYIPSPDETSVLDNASLAVPYLMYKKAVDLLVRPRSLGGLAFSAAKADRLVHAAFGDAGAPACCSSSMTERQLLKAGGAAVAASDARKVLSKLSEVGDEARSKVPGFLESLLQQQQEVEPEHSGEVGTTVGEAVADAAAPPPSGSESHPPVMSSEELGKEAVVRVAFV